MAHEIDIELQFPEDLPEIRGTTVRTRLEDVTMADAPARTVTEEVLSGVDLPAGSPLHATLRVPEEAVDPRASYSVRVHVDTTGDGRIGPGDYVSAASHPVLTSGRPSRIVVPLRRVG